MMKTLTLTLIISHKYSCTHSPLKRLVVGAAVIATAAAAVAGRCHCHFCFFVLSSILLLLLLLTLRYPVEQEPLLFGE
jgi:hypothetical protein